MLRGSGLGRRIGLLLVARAQRAIERRHVRVRRELMKQEEYMETALAFAGPGE